jgi:glycosyltransferase involved in cell wall biosynthesis
MTPKPLISVVIPTWNEAKYLPPCIASIQAQTYPHYEVIVVDKDSADGTQALCAAAGWRVYPQVRPGISAARAEGFARAQGEIIASTSADTILPRGWLDGIAGAFDDPRVVGAYGPVVFIEGQSRKFYEFMNVASRAFFDFSNWVGQEFAIGENFAVRKSAYMAIGGFNLKLPTAEDIDLNNRIRSVGDLVYDRELVAYTSNRRLAHEKLHFFSHHVANYLRVTLLGTASSDFKPIR